MNSRTAIENFQGERAVYSTNGSLFDPRLVERRQIWAARDLVRLGACLFCSKQDSPEVAIRQDGLVMHECAACGLAYIDPRPSSEQLARYYREGYFSGAKDFFQNKDYCIERDNGIRTKSVTGYREILNHLDVSGKKVLDVGCASGALLYLMREHGASEVVGIDSAAYPVKYGVENYGLDLRCSDIENARLPDAYFDLVALIDVIEHVENLHSMLAELRRVIRPGGHLFIITPNYSSYFLARDQWTCLYKDFEHLQYFSEQSLREVFRNVGIRLVKSWTESVPFKTYDYPRLYKSGVHRLLHPRVAAKNTLAQIKYKRALSTQLCAGSNLIAVLRAH